MQLTPDLLLRAYAIGIFPMAESRLDQELHWIDPDMRGILPLDRLHVPRKLRNKLRKGTFQVRCNTAFHDVILGCAEPAENRPDTWINPVIERLYTELNDMGFAHSVECWDGARLVGGLYGVALGGAFFGESMFSRTTDASKIALVHLVMRLRRSGFLLLDTQFNTPHLSRFGVTEIPRENYRKLLTQAVSTKVTFYSGLVSASELESFLQSTTQTS
ncbi:leucyl/phenylalanyl-tRNA--protein transferase [Pelagibius litoralis]|uniref:Leucyl/phenylalanyl-tRNA--protein transferase n=1 Tax=Pelagibius litoralis TaxID=374515 RepID=A0A967C4X3_9PROT|nr:leucyl/phenylalanyl-tRNA--protein transferase [Pelagibius litoralis]NIA68769.1 leucyl/phenylalanyl-tRNA--protein transferase [Pelagibius litoralis]